MAIEPTEPRPTEPTKPSVLGATAHRAAAGPSTPPIPPQERWSRGGFAEPPAYRDRNALRWLTAYTASLVGDSVYFLALGFAAARTVGPAQVGLVMAAGAVPRAVLMLGGGVVADRFGPRRVVIGSDATRCVLVLAAAAVVAVDSTGLRLLVVLALAFGVVDALFMPAVGALPPRLVGAGQLARLQGLRTLAMRLGEVGGPPLGGLAMGLGGAGAALGTAGVLFAISVPLLVTTRMDRPPARPADGPAAPATAWQELCDGLRYLRRHRLLGALVLSGAISELGMNGPLNVGLVLLSQSRGWGAAGYGWIVAAFGAGSTCGALLLTVRGRMERAGAVQIGTLFSSGALLGVLPFLPGLSGAVLAGLTAGAVCGLCGGLANSLIQTAADPAYLGRVTAVMSLTGVGLSPLAYPLFGAAVAAWGAPSVFVGSACLPRSAGSWAWPPRRCALPAWGRRRSRARGRSGPMSRPAAPTRPEPSPPTASTALRIGRLAVRQTPSFAPYSFATASSSPSASTFAAAWRPKVNITSSAGSPVTVTTGAPLRATAVRPSGRRSTRPTGERRPTTRAIRSRRLHRASAKTGSTGRGVQSSAARRTSSACT